MKKCEWEEESISTCCPSIIHLRCRFPVYDKKGKQIKYVDNCIGYDACAEYVERKNE